MRVVVSTTAGEGDEVVEDEDQFKSGTVEEPKNCIGGEEETTGAEKLKRISDEAGST